MTTIHNNLTASIGVETIKSPAQEKNIFYAPLSYCFSYISGNIECVQLIRQMVSNIHLTTKQNNTNIKLQKLTNSSKRQNRSSAD